MNLAEQFAVVLTDSDGRQMPSCMSWQIHNGSATGFDPDWQGRALPAKLLLIKALMEELKATGIQSLTWCFSGIVLDRSDMKMCIDALADRSLPLSPWIVGFEYGRDRVRTTGLSAFVGQELCIRGNMSDIMPARILAARSAEYLLGGSVFRTDQKLNAAPVFGLVIESPPPPQAIVIELYTSITDS